MTGWVKGFLWVSVIVLMIIFCTTTFVQAQSAGATTGNVTGTVTDPQGKAIGGASVKIRSIQTNFVREINSNDDGSFLAPQLVPGTYEATVSAEGFSPIVSTVEVVLGNTALVSFNLNIGGNSEIILVQSSSAISQGKTEGSTNIGSQVISNLPINRRDFIEFTLTSPRATIDRIPKQGVTDTSRISFNGQSARVNNITIDGLDNNDPFAGTVRSTFGQDAVQEFQVVSDSYSAEFGRALGGIVNIVTRGGGNELHGGLFFLNRNDTISTRDVFTPFKPPYKQYQFGASLSGPLKKDKAFYFSSFERLSVKQNNFVTISNDVINSANKLGFGLRNGPIPFSLGSTQFLARGDGQLSKNDTLYVRYNISKTYNGQLEPFGALTAETNGGIQKLKDQAIAITNTYSSTKLNLINETRFLYSRRDQRVIPLGEGPQVGLFVPEGRVNFGRGTFLPQNRQERIYQVVDTVSLSRNRQQIKFGFDYLYNLFPSNTDVPIFPGGLTFFVPLDFAALLGNPAFPAFSAIQAFDPSLRTPAQRGFLMALASQLPALAPGFPQNVPLADLSLPQAYAQGFGDTRLRVPQKAFSAFVQNDIKVCSNLLIKLGLRYDLVRIDKAPQNNGNFSPRIALAYQPAKLPKANIHASYGIFFSGLQVTGATTAIQTLSSGALKIPVIPFPFSVLAFAQPGNRFPVSTTLPAGVTFIPQLSQTFTYQKDLRNSYTQQASFGIDYQLGTQTILSLNYDFVRGIKLFSNRNINPVVRPIANDPVGSQLTGRVDPTNGNVFEFESSFDSYYSGFTVSVQRRFSKNIGFNGHYTFSKALDNFIDFRTDLQEVLDPLRPGDERALSVQDVRSRFVFSGTWDLNYTKNPFLTGFQLSTIINLNSGRPYNLLSGTDLNQNGDNPPGDRPFVNGAFLGRNLGITPGFANMDLRLTRNISIKERYKILVYLEAFNLFNRTNISDVSRNFFPDAQGNFQLPSKSGSRFEAAPSQFISAFPSRQLQFGFRLSF